MSACFNASNPGSLPVANLPVGSGILRGALHEGADVARCGTQRRSRRPSRSGLPARPRQIVIRLHPQPALGVAPADSFQRECHIGRYSSMPMQQSGERDAGHAEPSCRLTDRPSGIPEAVLQTLSRMRRVRHSPHRLTSPVIVDQVRVRRRVTLEAKDDSPIPGHPHTPWTDRAGPDPPSRSTCHHTECGRGQGSSHSGVVMALSLESDPPVGDPRSYINPRKGTSGGRGRERVSGTGGSERFARRFLLPRRD